MQRPRDACEVLQDLLSKRRCPEICVQYSCNHCEEIPVTLPPVLQDKENRRNGRTAVKVLKAQCKRSERCSRTAATPLSPTASPLEDEAFFRMEISPARCQECFQLGRSNKDAGEQDVVRCGGVVMLLPRDKPDGRAIPLAISARQLLSYVAIPLLKEPQRVPLATGAAERRGQSAAVAAAAASAALKEDPALGALEGIRTATGCSPLFLGALLWVIGCVAYAYCHTTESSLVNPELFYEQLQTRIDGIPVPQESPQYAKYKQYYLMQYQQHLQEYNAHQTQLDKNRPLMNWQALFHGLVAGVLVFAALLVYCEYHYGAISVWMELVEEFWYSWRARCLCGPADPLADSKRMERFLKDMGEEQQPASTLCKTAAAKKDLRDQKEKEKEREKEGEKEKKKELSSPPAVVKEPQRKLSSASVTASTVSSEAPSTPTVIAPTKAKVTVVTPEKKVPEPYHLEQLEAKILASEAEIKPAALPSSRSCRREALPEPLREPSPEPACANNAAWSVDEESFDPCGIGIGEAQESCAESNAQKAAALTAPTAPSAALGAMRVKEAMPESWLVGPSMPDGPVSNVRERLRRKVIERSRQHIKNIVHQVVSEPDVMLAPTTQTQRTKAFESLVAGGTNSQPLLVPESKSKTVAAEEEIAPEPRKGAALLREAEELLSQLEAEDLLRQVEAEDDRKQRAKTKAKKKAAEKAAKNEQEAAAVALAAAVEEQKKAEVLAVDTKKKPSGGPEQNSPGGLRRQNSSGSTSVGTNTPPREVLSSSGSGGDQGSEEEEVSSSPAEEEDDAQRSMDAAAKDEESESEDEEDDDDSDDDDENQGDEDGEADDDVDDVERKSSWAEVVDSEVEEETYYPSFSLRNLPCAEELPPVPPSGRRRSGRGGRTRGGAAKSAKLMESSMQPAATFPQRMQQAAFATMHPAPVASAPRFADLPSAVAKRQAPTSPTGAASPPSAQRRLPAPPVAAPTAPPTQAPSAAPKSAPRCWAEAVCPAKTPTVDVEDELLDEVKIRALVLEELQGEAVEQILEWFDQHQAINWLKKHSKGGNLAITPRLKWRGSKVELLCHAADLLDPRRQEEKEAPTPASSSTSTCAASFQASPSSESISSPSSSLSNQAGREIMRALGHRNGFAAPDVAPAATGSSSSSTRGRRKRGGGGGGNKDPEAPVCGTNKTIAKRAEGQHQAEQEPVEEHSEWFDEPKQSNFEYSPYWGQRQASWNTEAPEFVPNMGCCMMDSPQMVAAPMMMGNMGAPTTAYCDMGNGQMQEVQVVAVQVMPMGGMPMMPEGVRFAGMDQMGNFGMQAVDFSPACCDQMVDPLPNGRPAPEWDGIRTPDAED